MAVTRAKKHEDGFYRKIKISDNSVKPVIIRKKKKNIPSFLKSFFTNINCFVISNLKKKAQATRIGNFQVSERVVLFLSKNY